MIEDIIEDNKQNHWSRKLKW